MTTPAPQYDALRTALQWTAGALQAIARGRDRIRIGDEIRTVDEVLDAANAALETSQSGWLPISEAPQGRDVLLYSPRYLDLTIGDWRHYCGINQPRFTHYQELPPPPSTKGEPT